VVVLGFAGVGSRRLAGVLARIFPESRPTPTVSAGEATR
jgi:hypothetical protein